MYNLVKKLLDKKFNDVPPYTTHVTFCILVKSTTTSIEKFKLDAARYRYIYIKTNIFFYLKKKEIKNSIMPHFIFYLCLRTF